jgi:hypothetical protein
MFNQNNMSTNSFVPAFGANKSEINYLMKLEKAAHIHANKCAATVWNNVMANSYSSYLPMELALQLAKAKADISFFCELQNARYINSQHINEIIAKKNKHSHTNKHTHTDKHTHTNTDKKSYTKSGLNSASKTISKTVSKTVSKIISKPISKPVSDILPKIILKPVSDKVPKIIPKPISAFVSVDVNNLINTDSAKKLNKPIRLTPTSKSIFWKRVIGSDKLDAYFVSGYKNPETDSIETPYDFCKKCKSDGVVFKWNRKYGTLTLSSDDRNKMNVYVQKLRQIIGSIE